MKNLFSLLFVIFFSQGEEIMSQWNVVKGLPRGEYSRVHAYNDTLYASTGNLIYISTSAGDTWIPTNVIKNEVDFISVLLKVDNRIFVGTYGYGIFQSKDNGVSWLAFNNGLTSILDIADIVQRGDSIYVGTIGSSIYTTKIDGNSWTAFNQSIPMNNAGTVYSLYNFNGRLITGSGVNANIYYNDNGTIIWNEIHFAEFNPLGTSMVALISVDTILYGIGSQGIYKSTNNGLNWEYFNPGIGYIELGAFYLYKETIFTMLTKANSTYYFTCNYNSDQWTLFDYQPGMFSYNFVISDNKIFAATFDGLYYRNMTSTSIKKKEELPVDYKLYQNYPNPFNPTTTIQYEIPESGFITLKIYDELGREVKTLINQYKNKGSHEINFNASQLSSGVYLYRLTAGDYLSTKKMLLLK